MKLPADFKERMKTILQNDFPAFERALLNGNAEKGLFVTRKMHADALCSRLPFPLEQIPYCENGFYFQTEFPGRHPLHHAGAFYVQDPSAMATVCALEIREGWKILDCCAAPGGKSIQLACAAGQTGLLVANEINHSRRRVLASNIERAGLGNAVVTGVPAQTLRKWYPAYFDLVLADVPCSGEGMFRKYEAALAGWNEGLVRSCEEKQREILENVCTCVADGGYLLYSTCTFSPEENELQIERFLERHPEFSLCPVRRELLPYTAEGLGEAARLTRRFYPHLARGEGQFIALLKKNGTLCADRPSPAFRDTSVHPSREENAILRAFLSENTVMQADAAQIRKFRDGFRLLSTEHPVPETGVFAYGINLGSIEKGIFHPHHQFFSAYGSLFTRKISLSSDSPEAALYLAGQTLPTDVGNGWCAVLMDSAPVGGGKAVNGVLKNHYPKGLRMI